MSRAWHIRLTPTAEAQLTAITDLRVRRLIAERIDRLVEKPQQQDKPLAGELAGYRSVVALAIRREGSRTDMYALAQRLLRQGVLGPAAPDDSAQKKPQVKGENKVESE